MNWRRGIYFVYFWITLFFVQCAGAIHIPVGNLTNSRTDRERNVMVVLPVMQGSDDPSDPRLQFWYTKPPVTVVIGENGKERKTRPSSGVPTTTTPRYSDADVTTLDIITTNLPLFDYDIPEIKQDTDNRSPIQESHKKPQNLIRNESANWLASDQDIHLSFMKNKLKFSPSAPSGSEQNLQIISAEPNWKSDMHRLIEQDKLKFQTPKPPPEVSTILPSSTRIQFYSDFMPIGTDQKIFSPQKSTVLKPARKPSPEELRFPATEGDNQYDFIKVYDMMKKVSLKPVSFPKVGHVEHISSSDREFFDVLREMAVPTESLFKDRSTSQPTLKTPSSRATEQWVFTYGPEELSTLPTEVTGARVTTGNPTTTSQQPPLTMVSSTSLPIHAITSDDKLTNDFKQMLIALGILKDEEITTTTESNELWMDPESFTTNPLSYSKFKKLPVIEELPPIRKDMQALLNSFGLLPKIYDGENFTPTRVTRQSKKLRSEPYTNNFTKKSEMKHTLSPKKKSTISANRSNSSTPIKVSSPSVLLFRGLQKISPEEQPSISANRSNSTNPIKLSNPSVLLFRGLQKRPNLRTRLFTVFTPLLPTKRVRKVSHTKKMKKPVLRPTTVKPKRADNSSVTYEDLADSFGGGETAKNDTMGEELETTTPNGLYFLFDWNWFLKTGDTDDERPIRLNFSPHVGDPKRFIPIDFP